MKRMVRYVSAVALVCTLGMASVVQAQDRPYDDKSEQWWAQLSAQFNDALKSPVEQVQVQTMRHVIFFAANYPDKFDTGLVMPKLLEIYDYAGQEDLRVLALAAIDAAQEEYAMQHLIGRVERERSPRVHRLTMAVLTGYYNKDTG